MSGRLEGRQVLVTHAERYIGPAHIADNMYYTSEMLEDDEVREQFEPQIPAGRIGEGREAAELVLALATGASGFLAGQVIPISGGWVT